MKKGYFLGLDIGTDSVGWAVTDTDYKLCKCNGKALWGVRLFESANTAEERRTFRTARRRLERRKQRIEWLQQVFSEEIGRVDPAFFQRLRESRFCEDDKKGAVPLGRYTLFAGKDYCDKDYYREFPTIYHLRFALMQPGKRFDARLVYLALHHILKYRGHFLFGDLSMESITLEAGLERLNLYLEAEYGSRLNFKDVGRVAGILTDKSNNTMQKRKLLLECAGISKEQPQFQAILELMAGRTVSLNALYADNVETDELHKLCLRDDFEEVEGKLLLLLGDRIELILGIKEIYDWALLAEMRKGERYLSAAKIKAYEKHRDDLTRLKNVIRSVGNAELYREIFHNTQKSLDNYPAYSGHGADNYRCDYEKFQKYLMKKLKTLPSGEALETILTELEAGTFLPKQTVKDNGVIPHQLHEIELKQILECASAYLPFLNERDESGLSKKEQIVEIFRFRIPYYVGPLASASSHSWLTRGEGKIYPWNFKEIVDIEKTAESFITRMTAKCSYIGEDVLPKDSLLYSKFMALNELNKLKINGNSISVELKQRIYREFLLEGRGRRLKNYLLSAGLMQEGDTISGIDGELKATLRPWKTFGWLLERSGGEEMTEDIIRHIVLFGADRKLLASWLKKAYGNRLDDEDRKRILAVKLTGWGRLSRQFLTEILDADPQTEEAVSIIEALWRTNDNLMELLSGRYGFAQKIEEYRNRKFAGCQYTLGEYLKDSYASPGIKRAIHQTIKIVQELKGVMHGAPKRIFVEMAREKEAESKRYQSRRTALIEQYKKCGEEANTLFEQLERRTDGELRRDKLYLYYTQLGKCMYSGEPIDLESLDYRYDIEHIYPQSKVKDDSLDNRVLVKRELNAQKSNAYPIAPEIRKKMRPFWTALRAKGFISQKKFDRLTRASAFREDELAGFIARQLVETRQSSKIVAELLGRLFGEQTEIVYVKAGNVSSFRQDQRITEDGTQKQAGRCGRSEKTIQDPLFVKCREVNDFHHAKDAYLNIVVGNVYHLKFTKSPLRFIQSGTQYSLNRMFDFDVTNGKELAWQAGTEGTICTVRHAMRKNNILFTRMAFEAGGGLFDQQIVPKGKGQAQIKGADARMKPEKYGGYNNVRGAYFCMVEHSVKKKRIRSIEAVYLMHKKMYEQDPIRYCTEILHLEQPKILMRRIKINTLVSFDGFRMHISGRQGVQILYKNANQIVLAPQWNVYCKAVGKYLDRCRLARFDLPLTSFDGISAEQNRELYRILLGKLDTPRYSVKYDTPAKWLRDYADAFEKLALPDQCRVLMQILNLFRCNAANADLKLLCGKGGIGKLQISKNLNTFSLNDFHIIHQSVTGIFEQEVDLIKEEIK